MKELDLLKKDWQKSDNFKQLSENDIYGMLQKKSTSIVRSLLIISILEFFLWIFINIFYENDDFLLDKKLDTFETVINYLEYFGFFVILIFIYLLYHKYKKISVTASVKQLMIAILNTKKIVQYYVWYNLIFLVISIFIGTYFAIIVNPDSTYIVDKMQGDAKFLIAGILILMVFTVVILGVFWLFYKLLYGILLKRLYANYKELKKIDI